MRRRTRRTIKRGWAVLAIMGAAGIAGLAAGWSRAPAPATDLSAAEIVAARFPRDAGMAPAMPADRAAAAAFSEHRLALFDPQPISPQPVIQVEPARAPGPAPTQPMAPATQPAPIAYAAPAAQSVPAAHETPVHSKPAVHRAANRPGYVFNDAQIASIKRRLNLTPDQERMWPAVEAALRNMAYTKAHAEPPRRGAAKASHLASIDPDSAQVQNLKSAAFPLIMSFSAEQKSEVRALAHVMGLEKLASQF